MQRSKEIALFVWFVLQIFQPNSYANAAERKSMPLTISAKDDPVLNKANLDRIKRHIIAGGKRCTYSQMYNNNPCWDFGELTFYLNPDPGPGSNGHPQWNLNSDISRGDFNTLVVTTSEGGGYIFIKFMPGKPVRIDGLAHIGGKPSPKELDEAKESIRVVVKSALKAIEDSERR